MYKIVGADNREYGPVSQEEILQWIAQGRANAKTIARFEQGAWKPLATFDEFKAALNIPATPPAFGDTTIPSATGNVPKANATAVTGLVFGILGLFCCPCVGPTTALICGFIGLNQIKENPRAYSTDAALPKIAIGLGVAGWIFSIVLALKESALRDLFK